MVTETSMPDGLSVLEIFTGRVAPFGPRGEPSAYLKGPVAGPVDVGEFGIDGDEQADLAVHGGIDKALHHYPFDHYAAFASERPQFAAMLGVPGFFGENISTAGWTEWDVCIGDRFTLGSAEIELSQGRSPCWKLGHRFGDPSMVDVVVKTRRAGWYYRVLRTGRCARGDRLSLVDRPHPDWPVARAFGLLVAGERDRDGYAELAAMEELGLSWRNRAERLVTLMAAGA